MRGLVALALIACSDRAPSPPAPEPTAPADWKPRCDAVLANGKLAPAVRAKQLLDACQPCGDWAPILGWAEPSTRREDIDAALARCSGYCTAGAKQRFLGTLDDARAKGTRTPWRFLGQMCGEPEAVRYWSAPFFALDRIARATGTDAVVALPPVGVNGEMIALPAAPVVSPDVPRHGLLVLDQHALPEVLPVGRLTAKGLVVDAAPPAASTRTLLLAPAGLPARRLVEALAPAQVYALGAALRSVPAGWSLPGRVPVDLTRDTASRPTVTYEIVDRATVDAAIARIKAATSAELASPTVVVRPGSARVSDLADLLGALAYRTVSAATLTAP